MNVVELIHSYSSGCKSIVLLLINYYSHPLPFLAVPLADASFFVLRDNALNSISSSHDGPLDLLVESNSEAFI